MNRTRKSPASDAPGPQSQAQAPRVASESPLSLYGNSLVAGNVPAMAGLLERPRQWLEGLFQDEDLAETETLATAFTVQARELFDDIDLGGDGLLSEEEIDLAMLNPDLSIHDAASVATLKKFRETLQDASDDGLPLPDTGISQEDLTAYSEDESLWGRIDGRFAAGILKIHRASTDLFTDPSRLVDVNAIQQGWLGNCQFPGIIGSLVAQRPDIMDDMIEPLEDGTFRVMFATEEVVVDAPTPAEFAYYASSGSDGMWMTLVERAYGQMRNPDALLPQDLLVGDGSSNTVQDFVGGDVFTQYQGEGESITETRARLHEAISNDRVVSAGLDERTEGLPGNHRYSVLDYDAESDLVTVRNPWGHTEHSESADGKNDGVFTVPVKDFDRIFSRIYYQTPPASQDRRS